MKKVDYYILYIILILIVIYIVISFIFYQEYFLNNCIEQYEMEKRFEIREINMMSDKELEKKFPDMKFTVTDKEGKNWVVTNTKVREDWINLVSNLSSEEICHDIFNNFTIDERISLSITWDAYNIRPLY